MVVPALPCITEPNPTKTRLTPTYPAVPHHAVPGPAEQAAHGLATAHHPPDRESLPYLARPSQTRPGHALPHHCEPYPAIPHPADSLRNSASVDHPPDTGPCHSLPRLDLPYHTQTSQTKPNSAVPRQTTPYQAVPNQACASRSRTGIGHPRPDKAPALPQLAVPGLTKPSPAIPSRSLPYQAVPSRALRGGGGTRTRVVRCRR